MPRRRRQASVLRFAGLRYIEAQEPDEETLERLRFIRDLAKEHGIEAPEPAPAAPVPKGERPPAALEAPSLEETKQVLKSVEPESEEEEIKDIEEDLKGEKLPEAIKDLVDRITDELRKRKVKYKGVKPGGFYIEKDGIDIIMDVSTTQTPDAELLFDFTTSFSLETVTKVLEDPRTLLTSTGSQLNEVVLTLCKLPFAAINQKQIDGLLDTVATLQNTAVDFHPGEVQETVKQEGELQETEWLLEITNQIASRYDGVDIKDRKELIELAQGDVSKENLSKETAEDYEKFLKNYDQKKWEALMEVNEEAVRRRRYVPSTKLVQKAIDQYTGGRYKGKYEIYYDASGYLWVAIDAPYKFEFKFDRRANNLDLVEAGFKDLCNGAYKTSNQKLVPALINADLNLGILHKQSAQPGVSEDRSQALQDYEGVAKELSTRILDLQEEKPGSLESFQRNLRRRPEEFVEYARKNPQRIQKLFANQPDLVAWIKKNLPEVAEPLAGLLT